MTDNDEMDCNISDHNVNLVKEHFESNLDDSANNMNLIDTDPFEFLEVFKPTECFLDAPLSPDYNEDDSCEIPFQDDNSSSNIYSPGKNIILTKVFKKKNNTSRPNVNLCVNRIKNKKINKPNKKIQNKKKSNKRRHCEKISHESAGEDSDDTPLSEVRRKYLENLRNIAYENSEKTSDSGKKKMKISVTPLSKLKTDGIPSSLKNPIWKEIFMEDQKNNISLKKIKIWYEKLKPISVSEAKFFGFEYNDNEPYVKYFQEEELSNPPQKHMKKLMKIKLPKQSDENDWLKKDNRTPVEDHQKEKDFPIFNNGFMSPSISDFEEDIGFPSQCKIQCGNPLKTHNVSDQILRNEDPEIVDDESEVDDDDDDDDPPSFHDYGDEASMDMHTLEPSMDLDVSDDQFSSGSTKIDISEIKKETRTSSPDSENLELDSSKELYEPFHNHEHAKCKVVNLICPACDELCNKLCDYRFHSILHTREEILFKKVPPFVSICDSKQLVDVLCDMAKSKKSEKNVQRHCPGCKKPYMNQRTMMLHYKMQHLMNN